MFQGLQYAHFACVKSEKFGGIISFDIFCIVYLLFFCLKMNRFGKGWTIQRGAGQGEGARAGWQCRQHPPCPWPGKDTVRPIPGTALSVGHGERPGLPRQPSSGSGEGVAGYPA